MSDFDDPGTTEDEKSTEHIRHFEDFLESESDLYNYTDDIHKMVRTGQTRLIVNLDDLRDWNRKYATGLLKEPFEFVEALDKAVQNLIERGNGTKEFDTAVDLTRYKVGLSGSFGDHHVSPRTLHAAQLGTMISLEGIITRCSLVRPKMLKSVHYCPETNLFHEREYRDATSSTSNLPPTPSVTPQTNDDGQPLQIEYGHCTFRDHQRISIQEMPERAPAGQLPRSTDIILDDDLVDKCKPGDRIQLVGVYRSVGGGSSGAFKCVAICCFAAFSHHLSIYPGR